MQLRMEQHRLQQTLVNSLFTFLAICLQIIFVTFTGVCLEYTQEPCAAGQIGLPP